MEPTFPHMCKIVYNLINPDVTICVSMALMNY